MPKEEMAQSGERYYQCPVCWKTFTKPHTVKIHMRVHTGERPYQCPYCPKCFTTSGNLGDHLRVHSPARMFKCKLCGAKFKRKATLKRHHEMHSKYRKEKTLDGGSDVLQKMSENGEEFLQNEIIYQPLYFTNCEPNQRIESNTGIIVTEQNEELLQTEIVNYPCHSLDEFQENRTTSIELLLQPEDARESQENIVVIPPLLKEEKLDDFYDATILELSEEAEDVDGMLVKVHSSLTGGSNVISKPSVHLVVDNSEEKHNSLPNQLPLKSKSDGLLRHSSVFKTTLKAEHLGFDLSRRYGAYITKMLKLFQLKEDQTKLIKELNQTIQEFIIENR